LTSAELIIGVPLFSEQYIFMGRRLAPFLRHFLLRFDIFHDFLACGEMNTKQRIYMLVIKSSFSLSHHFRAITTVDLQDFMFSDVKRPGCHSTTFN